MRSRTSLILLVAGLTAALLVTGAMVLEGGPPDGAGTGAPGLLSGGGEEPVRGDRRPDAAAAEAGGPAHAAAPLPVEATPAPPTGAETLTIAIVRADTRAPVPGAQLWSWSEPAAYGADGPAAWLSAGRLDEHVPGAEAHRADGQGRVRVTASEGGLSVVAASGGLWGCATFAGQGGAPLVVALEEDRDVRVQVLDGKGAAVGGVPVILRQRRGPASFDVLATHTAAPDGIALLAHAGHFLRAAPGEAFEVAVPGPLDPPLARSIALADPPDELVTLVLEPCGSCEVTVTDAYGQRLYGPLDATLRLAAAGSASVPEVGEGCSETLRSRSGEDVLFEHVELGRRLDVVVRREGSTQPLSASGPGPRAPGDRVRLTVQEPVAATILRGRVVDADGQPIGHLAVRVHVAAQDGRLADAAWSLSTGEDGRFAIEVGPAMLDAVHGELVVVRLGESGAELERARQPLPEPFATGAHALGDFVLRAAPVAIAGVVVDADSQPVEGAEVIPSVVDFGVAAEAEVATAPTLAPVHSDAQGRFELYGDIGPASLALAASKDGRFGGPVIARAGARDVRLVLDATGSLAGRVLLDASLLDSLVLVQAEREAAPGEPADVTDPRPSALDREGRFALRNLPPGSYRVAVVYAATGAEIGHVEPVLVGTGGAACDPRLDPLDLRARGWLIDLELVDEVGVAIDDGRSLSRPSDTPGAAWVSAVRDGGRLRLLGDGRPVDVAIVAPGFRRAQLERVEVSQRVVLRHEATLRLVLARGLRLPEPPFGLAVELTPLDAEAFGGFVDSTVATFDDDATLVCHVPCSGALRVELALRPQGAKGSLLVPVHETLPRVISVADHPFEQEFEIRFDPAALAAAERELHDDP